VAEPVATVILVNYNGAHLLPDCLSALRTQTLAGRFETWVVDNASWDGSVDLLRRDYPEVRVIPSPTNTGFAGGNNLALRELRTAYAVLLNNDARPEPDWLERLLEPFTQPGGERVGAVTSKILFLPRFLPVSFETAGFSPGPHDARQLGVRILDVLVDDVPVTDAVLWESSTYPPEGSGDGRFRWSRPAGTFLVPLPPGVPAGAAVRLTLRWTAERTKELRLHGPDGTTTTATVPVDEVAAHVVRVPTDKAVDVINNVGGIVLRSGYGADRGYQEIDEGRYDEPEDVFLISGAAVALRSEALADVGVFDDDFFLYYEDTDLSWRLHLRGWRVRYEPGAVVRHIHSATSKEWSPLFVFHVDRNRLLMLTKDATARLAVREVLRYPLTTASMTVRAARVLLRERRRPALRPLALRARVMASYLRLLGPMLARRRAIRGQASARRSEVEARWLVESR
jgi:GT2 family glycosyltransferase